MTKKKKPQLLAEQAEILHAEISFLNLSFESYFPTRVKAIMNGSLRHSSIWIKEIKTTQEGNSFNIEFITEGKLAFGAPVQFHEQVPLDVAGLPPGSYTVYAGDQTATFVVEPDTIIVPSDLGPAVDRSRPMDYNTTKVGSRISLLERLQSLRR